MQALMGGNSLSWKPYGDKSLRVSTERLNCGKSCNILYEIGKRKLKQTITNNNCDMCQAGGVTLHIFNSIYTENISY